MYLTAAVFRQVEQFVDGAASLLSRGRPQPRGGPRSALRDQMEAHAMGTFLPKVFVDFRGRYVLHARCLGAGHKMLGGLAAFLDITSTQRKAAIKEAYALQGFHVPCGHGDLTSFSQCPPHQRHSDTSAFRHGRAAFVKDLEALKSQWAPLPWDSTAWLGNHPVCCAGAPQ